MLGERAARGLLERVLPGGVGDDAELVAAGPVGAAAELGDRVGERRAEAQQQRVAGEVAEGVVVVLEAVEVEHRQHDRRLGGGGPDPPLEVGEQLAAVAQAGQRVGGRVRLELAAGGAQRDAGEGDHQQRDHEHRDRHRPEPERKLPVGVVARATTIQSLALPLVDLMRRYAVRRPPTSVTPAARAQRASSAKRASRGAPSAAPIRCGRALSMTTLPVRPSMTRSS